MIFTAAIGVLVLLGRARGRRTRWRAHAADAWDDSPLTNEFVRPRDEFEEDEEEEENGAEHAAPIAVKRKPINRRNPILVIVPKFLIPYVFLFALYVQFHGDFGPGGGFQAGVIFASGFIIYAVIFGVDTARQVLPAAITRLGLSAGVLLYAGVGVAGLLMGGNYLDYGVLAHDPVHGQHLGITLIEFGVGTTVASAMVTLFFTYAGQDR